MDQSSIVPQLPRYPHTPLSPCPTPPPHFSSSKSRYESSSSNSIARAWTRSSLSLRARINGPTAPGGADCAQVSRARSRTPTSGESSSLAIHLGTTWPSTRCAGSEDGTGPAWGLSPPGTVPLPDAEPVPFTEARGTGLAAVVKGSLRGNGLCLDRDSPSGLARGSRLGALSDEAGPQPASPARSSRLRSSTRCGHS